MPKAVQPFVVLFSILLAFLIGRHFDGSPPGIREDDAGPLRPADLIGSALKIEQGRADRARRLGQAFVEIDESNVDAIADLLGRSIDDLAPYEIRMFVDAWARFDSRAALEQAMSWPSGGARTAGASRAVSLMARRNPVEAKHVVVDMLSDQEGSLGVILVRELARGWIHNGDLEGAGQFIEEMPPNFDREVLTYELAEAILSEEGPDAVRRWASAVPEKAEANYKGVAYRKAALVLEPADRERTIAWLEEDVDRWFGGAGMRVLARKWATKEPEAALVWASRLPEGRSRHFAVSFAFQGWYESDPEAAREWLLNQTEGEPLDPARAQLANYLVDREPEAAAVVARGMADPKQRRRELVNIIGKWMKEDRAAADAWLERDADSGALRAEIEARRLRRAGGRAVRRSSAESTSRSPLSGRDGIQPNSAAGGDRSGSVAAEEET